MAKLATKSIDGTCLVFDFTDGEQLRLDVMDLPEAQRTNLLMHGGKQKLGDKYNSADTCEEARACVMLVWNSLMAGDWNLTKSGNGGILAEALVRLNQGTAEEIAAKLKDLDTKAKGKLRKHPQIALMIKTIEKEKADRNAEADAPPIESLLG